MEHQSDHNKFSFHFILLYSVIPHGTLKISPILHTMTSPLGLIKMKSAQKFGEHLETLIETTLLYKDTEAHKCTIIIISDNDKVPP